eukprot:m.479998 g.479998  ORF g.479998 m.479998 type:complete len:351 (-) comp21665_c0_seq1:201-1253(-)
MTPRQICLCRASDCNRSAFFVRTRADSTYSWAFVTEYSMRSIISPWDAMRTAMSWNISCSSNKLRSSSIISWYRSRIMFRWSSAWSSFWPMKMPSVPFSIIRSTPSESSSGYTILISRRSFSLYFFWFIACTSLYRVMTSTNLRDSAACWLCRMRTSLGSVPSGNAVSASSFLFSLSITLSSLRTKFVDLLMDAISSASTWLHSSIVVELTALSKSPCACSTLSAPVSMSLIRLTRASTRLKKSPIKSGCSSSSMSTATWSASSPSSVDVAPWRSARRSRIVALHAARQEGAHTTSNDKYKRDKPSDAGPASEQQRLSAVGSANALLWGVYAQCQGTCQRPSSVITVWLL